MHQKSHHIQLSARARPKGRRARSSRGHAGAGAHCGGDDWPWRFLNPPIGSMVLWQNCLVDTVNITKVQLDMIWPSMYTICHGMLNHIISHHMCTVYLSIYLKLTTMASWTSLKWTHDWLLYIILHHQSTKNAFACEIFWRNGCAFVPLYVRSRDRPVAPHSVFKSPVVVTTVSGLSSEIR